MAFSSSHLQGAKRGRPPKYNSIEERRAASTSHQRERRAQKRPLNAKDKENGGMQEAVLEEVLDETIMHAWSSREAMQEQTTLHHTPILQQTILQDITNLNHQENIARCNDALQETIMFGGTQARQHGKDKVGEMESVIRRPEKMRRLQFEDQAQIENIARGNDALHDAIVFGRRQARQRGKEKINEMQSNIGRPEKTRRLRLEDQAQTDVFRLPQGDGPPMHENDVGHHHAQVNCPREREAEVHISQHATTSREGQHCQERSTTCETFLNEPIPIALRNLEQPFADPNTSRSLLGAMDQECIYCGALYWREEKGHGMYTKCCGRNKVDIQLIETPPEYLSILTSPQHSDLREKIRSYNCAFAFTSTRVKSVGFELGPGVYTYRIQGAFYHMIGGLLPDQGEQPKFLQAYIYDPASDIQNRHQQHPNLDVSILATFRSILGRVNPYVNVFTHAAERLVQNPDEELSIVLRSNRQIVRGSDTRCYNAPTANEVAMILPGHGEEVGERDIVIQKRRGKELEFINALTPSYDALQYPLLFLRGEDGWTKDLPNVAQRRRVTMLQFYAYRLHIRSQISTIHVGGRLFQQYVVDVASRIEQNNLNFVSLNQKKMRAELYSGLVDIWRADLGLSTDQIGRRVILPATFPGSPRYMQQAYQDAMAIVRSKGIPDAFVTFTCNPKWEEISRELEEGQEASDRPDLVSRVFNMKAKEFLKGLRDMGWFAKVIGMVWTKEYQKRGLPHLHVLLIFPPDQKVTTINQIDSMVSAELPLEENRELYQTVTTCMLHGPCGEANPDAPCMKNGKCSKGYPRPFREETTMDENGYPLYRRQKNGRTFQRGDFVFDNSWVVPYNPYLSKKFNCHINVEISAGLNAIKYLFRYVFKGCDKASVEVMNQANEVKQFLDARYLGPVEAMDSILSFKTHLEWPPVYRLPVHLENQQSVMYLESEDLASIAERGGQQSTRLTGYFAFNATHESSRNVLYMDFPKNHVWKASEKVWAMRQRGEAAIGRMYFVPNTAGERFFLRLLLTVIPGATSFQHLRTIDGVVHDTFQQACNALGLLQDDAEWDICLREACIDKCANSLRTLFAMILVFCNPPNPERLWEHYKKDFCDDTRHHQIRGGDSNADGNNEALVLLDHKLAMMGKSLQDYPNMPLPDYGAIGRQNPYLSAERSYDVGKLQACIERDIPLLNMEQERAYALVMNAVEKGEPKIFFLDGPGGSGKTFLYRVLLATVRAKGEIAIAVASSGIAALLLEGGRTSHSVFKIPIPTEHDALCTFSSTSDIAEVLRLAKLIIWDEAPAQHRHCAEAVDRSLRDLMGVESLPFGGKVVVFGGDFRQCPPVVIGGERAATVNASLKHSTFWHGVTFLKLTENMRLRDDPSSRPFAEYLMRIGNGMESLISADQGHIDINSSESTTVGFCSGMTSCASAEELIDKVFPNLSLNYKMPSYVNGKCILTSTNKIVNDLNKVIAEKIPTEEHVYLSADSVGAEDDREISFPEEFLNSLTLSGLPPHKLVLKEGVPIILLRNLDISAGLCNGTRMVVVRLARRIIVADIIGGAHDGERVMISRVTTTSDKNKYPFVLSRRQFPIQLAFAMTINKAQGQTMDIVGLHLPTPVFTHGQLYVALSRATKVSNIYVHSATGPSTTNVVYKELLN